MLASTISKTMETRFAGKMRTYVSQVVGSHVVGSLVVGAGDTVGAGVGETVEFAASVVFVS